ncbi:hypothetical protein FJZ19_02285 [Candidatus Pacearchaeota archaeon]|nr:hypothetical protein [Candidatus Pacearchaeota archaeon]
MELKRVRVWSFVKICVLMGIIFGIILGIALSIYLRMTVNSLSAQLANPDVQAYLEQSGSDVNGFISGLNALSTGVLYTIPILFAVVSFVLSLLISLIYNILAKYLGGIKLELIQEKK